MPLLTGKKILIVGGAGFLGIHTIQECLSQGVAHVRVLDNFTSNLSPVIALKKKFGGHRFEVMEGDIRNKNTCTIACSNMDFVIHFAEVSKNLESMRCPDFYFDVNVRGSRNLIQAAIKCKVKKFIFGSTNAVYGDSKKAATEETKADPIAFYGSSKVIAEQHLTVRKYASLLTIKVLRYGNIFGYGQKNNTIFANLYKNIIDNLPTEIHGNGNQIRNMIYVKDAARATIMALHVGSSISVTGGEPEIYNIVGETLTVNEMYAILRSYCNIEYNKMTYTEPRGQDIKGFDIDGVLAEKKLNYRPEYNFEKAVKELCDITDQYNTLKGGK